MDVRQALAHALRTIRMSRGLTQEDFSDVSSRTYLSSLERGLKSPTIDKMQALAEVLDVHPLTILALAYMALEGDTADDVLRKVKQELKTIAHC